MRRFLLACAAWLLLACATAAGGCATYGPPCDEGGSVLTRAWRVDALNLLDRDIRISGYCASSCTMLLAVDRVCVERDAALGFHSAIWRGVGRDSFLNGVQARHYSRFPELRAWFEAGPMHTRGIWVLPARRLAHFGVPICRGD